MKMWCLFLFYFWFKNKSCFIDDLFQMLYNQKWEGFLIVFFISVLKYVFLKMKNKCIIIINGVFWE